MTNYTPKLLRRVRLRFWLNREVLRKHRTFGEIYANK